VPSYWGEFATLAGLHALAVASPGPDFALVLRQSIVHGRRTAIATSLGIGSGITLHVAYCVLGLAWIVQASPVAFTALKFVGAGYLAWIGLQALRARPRNADAGKSGDAAPGPPPRQAFLAGFLTNATNIKATLFFASVFTVVVDPRTPRLVQSAYGAWMVVATASWFTLVSLFFTQPGVRAGFLRFGHWFDRTMGVVLIALGVRLLLTSR
jgi:RhtB (resistance to homoserine/threonine) family protein